MLRIYLSHSVRGLAGPEASREIKDANCERIKLVAMTLRYELGSSVEIYVPGEHQLFTNIAYEAGLLADEQIGTIDNKIIDENDMVLCNVEASKGDVLQGGREDEVFHAAETKKPVLVFDKCSEAVAFVKDYLAGETEDE